MRKQLIGLFLLGVCGCNHPNTFRIEFDQVDILTTGGIVTLNKEKVGVVRDFKLNADKSTLATIQLHKPLSIPEDSYFILTYNILRDPEIVIESGHSEKPMDFNVIQKGQTRKIHFDTTENELSKAKYDNLFQRDSSFRVIDSITRAVFPVKEEIKK
ncbi:MAG: hypothetical protein JST46_00615 [Bacteroidetes bacterium]|nr:hypothetical protein [Bacteroidota bacterium]